MKTKIIALISIMVLFFHVSCNKKNNHEEQSCFPGFVWIQYVGETNHIKRFTLIRASENDSLFFLSNYKKETEGFSNDSLVFSIYCNNYVTDSKQFFKLKNYFISHNTGKQYILYNMDNNSVKIAVSDRCDSLEYVVNKGDKGYFSKMINSLKIKDQSLIEYLDYYERIIGAE